MIDSKACDGIVALVRIGMAACAVVAVAIPVGAIALAWWAWNHVAVTIR